MSKILIAPDDGLKHEGEVLKVSELFYETIQGEGVYAGVPAIFLRLSGCVLNCKWCDTKEVWSKVNQVSIKNLVSLFTTNIGILQSIQSGAHLVITGGSPLMQQRKLIAFLKALEKAIGFLPFIEMENECVIIPLPALVYMVDCWNNSPKLENAGNVFSVAYNTRILEAMSRLNNSWFKFVVNSYSDIQEILIRYVEKGLIKRKQVILMPEGMTRIQLENNRDKVIKWVVENRFRYSDRLQIIAWNDKISV